MFMATGERAFAPTTSGSLPLRAAIGCKLFPRGSGRLAAMEGRPLLRFLGPA